jgi:hypothetical protein
MRLAMGVFPVKGLLCSSRIGRQGFQSCGLGQIEPEIHIPHCLAGPSLDEVVNVTDGYEPLCP